MQHEIGTRGAATDDREHQDSGTERFYGAHQTIGAEQRETLIRTAAYVRAEMRGFRYGDPVKDWLAAEHEIDSQHRSR
jgi:hypothetical protein